MSKPNDAPTWEFRELVFSIGSTGQDGVAMTLRRTGEPVLLSEQAARVTGLLAKHLRPLLAGCAELRADREATAKLQGMRDVLARLDLDVQQAALDKAKASSANLAGAKLAKRLTDTDAAYNAVKAKAGELQHGIDLYAPIADKARQAAAAAVKIMASLAGAQALNEARANMDGLKEGGAVLLARWLAQAAETNVVSRTLMSESRLQQLAEGIVKEFPTPAIVGAPAAHAGDAIAGAAEASAAGPGLSAPAGDDDDDA